MKFFVAFSIFLTLAAAAPASDLSEAPENVKRFWDAMDKRQADKVAAEKRVFFPVFVGTVFLDFAARLINLKSGPKPWDTESGNCVVEVRTKNGGNCVMAASPAGEPAFTDFADWNVCYVHGQQYYTFPDAPGRASVGDVMVEFTAAGGVDGFTGDGLQHPQITFLSLDPPITMNMWEMVGSYKNRDPICTAMLDQKDGVFDLSEGRGWDAWKCAAPCKDLEGDWSLDD
ncbi:hypothetical protein NM208_g12740 [Fusarium decemcellulare]|uniref:Uncharacterized protein n=1 Tax=Fusarium decemcellulare TaxID=57161 RepID=A0ACC1RQ04_9HYPO|nr:hypothetical protein NM208_g12740 [Fusarium decemcellulare]